MQLWRLDATSDEFDGAFSRFHQHAHEAAVVGGLMVPGGWFVDWYAVDVEAPPTVVGRLLHMPWPNAPLDALLQLAAEPRIVADADFDSQDSTLSEEP